MKKSKVWCGGGWMLGRGGGGWVCGGRGEGGGGGGGGGGGETTRPRHGYNVTNQLSRKEYLTKHLDLWKMYHNPFSFN